MRLTQRQRQLSPALLILLVITTAGFKGCPTSNDLDRAAKASNELAHDVLLANRAVAQFYKSGKMSLATKDRVADKLGIIGQKGNSFNEALIQLDAKYPQGTVPPENLAFIRANLAELRQLYSEVLADLLPIGAQKAAGVLSPLNKDLTTIEKVVKQ